MIPLMMMHSSRGGKLILKYGGISLPVHGMLLWLRNGCSSSSIHKQLWSFWSIHRRLLSCSPSSKNSDDFGHSRGNKQHEQKVHHCHQSYHLEDHQHHMASHNSNSSSTLHCNSLQHQQAATRVVGCHRHRLSSHISGVLSRSNAANNIQQQSGHYQRALDRFSVLNPPAYTTFLQLRSLTTSKSSKKMADDEVTKAQSAGPQEETIFGMMLSGKINAKFIYEDEQCVAFDDINPTAKIHFLVIPRKTISQLSTATDDDEKLLGHLMLVANKVANEKGMGPDGYRVVINNGRHGCQSVYHLHLHVIGGQQLGWPPGTH